MLRSALGFLSLLPLLSVTVACGGEAPELGADQAPVVVASIFPVGDLVQRMAGNTLRVEVLLPAGASPATFDVTPRQLVDLVDAGLFVMIGGGLDEWVAPLASDPGGDARIVRLSEGISLLASGHDDHDHEAGEHVEEEASGNPHVWLDPILVRDRFLPRLAEALSSLHPESAQLFRTNADLLADSLTALDAEIRRELGPLAQKSFVVTHPAWSYYALRYGLEEVGVVHTHPGQEPSSRELAALLVAAREHQIRCLFVEPQIGEVAARALAVELSLPTCLVDPLGGPGQEGRDGYFSLLRFNTRQFVQGMGGGGS